MLQIFSTFGLCFQVNVLLELRYRSPLEGNEDSDEELEDDDEDEEFIPNVGLVSHKKIKAVQGHDSSDTEGNALMSLEQNIAKLEQSILANNGGAPHVTFANNGAGADSLVRRSTSLSENANESASFFQKKKRTFNFPNVKKRYVWMSGSY